MSRQFSLAFSFALEQGSGFMQSERFSLGHINVVMKLMIPWSTKLKFAKYYFIIKKKDSNVHIQGLDLGVSCHPGMDGCGGQGGLHHMSRNERLALPKEECDRVALSHTETEKEKTKVTSEISQVSLCLYVSLPVPHLSVGFYPSLCVKVSRLHFTSRLGRVHRLMARAHGF